MIAAPAAIEMLGTRTAAAAGPSAATPGPGGAALPAVGEADWGALDAQVRGWWDGDLVTMLEADLAVHTNGQFEPFPYVPAGGSPGAFPFLFNWDTQFINRALLVHGRAELVRNHILDHLLQIERYDRVLNYNVVRMQRSQPPLLPDIVRRYHAAQDDIELLMRAYGPLKNEYQRFWMADHHLTPTGLSTFRDIGRMDKQGAYYEAGLDNTPVWGEDVRNCVPLILNCALVKYADDMAAIATELRLGEEAAYWRKESSRRTDTIRRLCWDPAQGWFFEYDYVAGSSSPTGGSTPLGRCGRASRRRRRRAGSWRTCRASRRPTGSPRPTRRTPIPPGSGTCSGCTRSAGRRRR